MRITHSKMSELPLPTADSQNVGLGYVKVQIIHRSIINDQRKAEIASRAGAKGEEAMRRSGQNIQVAKKSQSPSSLCVTIPDETASATRVEPSERYGPISRVSSRVCVGQPLWFPCLGTPPETAWCPGV